MRAQNFQPSLTGLVRFRRGVPRTGVLGYFQTSLRDSTNPKESKKQVLFLTSTDDAFRSTTREGNYRSQQLSELSWFDEEPDKTGCWYCYPWSLHNTRRNHRLPGSAEKATRPDLSRLRRADGHRRRPWAVPACHLCPGAAGTAPATQCDPHLGSR